MIASLQLLTLLFSIFVQGSFASFSQGKCVTPTPAKINRFTNPCEYSVTYPYYLAPGQTTKSLIAKVNAKLSGALILNYPTSCQSSLIKHYCSAYFLKCKPNVNLTDVSTYNYQIYRNDTQTEVPVPYLRPCVSTCTTVESVCTGLFKVFDSAPNCYQRYDYALGTNTTATLPYRFDLNNNASTCFTAAATPVSGPKESYDRTATCKGFVDTFYMPTGNRVNTNFTYTQFPTAIQTAISTQLATYLNALPKWVDSECAIAVRQYICSSYFLAPQAVTIEQALVYSGLYNTPYKNAFTSVLNEVVYVPSYPSYDSCVHYSNVCAAFLIKANNAALTPNCNATTNLGGLTIRNFPSANQTIAASAIATGVYLKFPSSPHKNLYYNATEYPYEVQCPDDYVIPEHPDNEDVIWVPGTGCAASCISATWTHDEWEWFDTSAKNFPIAGFVFGVVLIVFIIAVKEVYHSYLVLIFAVLSTFNSIVNINFTQENRQDRFCYDNAVPRLQNQGDSTCTASAGIIIYTFIACSATTFLIVVDAHLRKMHHFHIVESVWYYIAVAIIIFLLPLIPTLYAADNEYLGFYRSQPWCFFIQTPFGPSSLDIAWTAIPVFVAICLAYGSLLISYYLERDILSAELKIAVSRHEPEDTPSARNSMFPWFPRHAPKNPIAARMVIWFSLIIFVAFTVYKFIQYFYYPDFEESSKKWTTCNFKNWDGTDSYREVCGEHPNYRPAPILNILNLLALTGNMIVLSPAYIIFYFAGLFICKYVPKEMEEGEPQEHLHYKPDESKTIELAPVSNVELIPVEKTETV